MPPRRRNPSAAGPAPEKGQDLAVKPLKIADGDSMTVQSGTARKRRWTIRMYGIDAPESKQPMGTESRKNLIKLLKAGRRNGELRANIAGQDRYGRAIALLYHRRRGPDQSINRAMVEQGYAYWYQRYAPGDQALKQAQEKARQQRRGVWKRERYHKEMPWDYRRRTRQKPTMAAAMLRPALAIIGLSLIALLFATARCQGLF